MHLKSIGYMDTVLSVLFAANGNEGDVMSLYIGKSDIYCRKDQ